MAKRRTRRGARLPLGALPVAMAAALALWSLGFGLPFLFRPDEDVMVGRAVRMAAEGSLDPLFQNYPPLAFYLFAAAEKLTGHLAGPITADPTGAYLTGRAVSAAAFATAVAATWLAGRRAYGEAAGLLAALALAVSPLAVREAHFATTDMIQAAFVAAALAAAAGPTSPRRLGLAGALCGLAAATKYTGGLVLLAVLVIAWRERGRGALRLPLAGAAIAFAVPCLVMLAHPRAYVDGLLFLQSNAYARDAGVPLGLVFHATVTLPYGLGPGTFAIALAGIAVAAVKRTSWDLALLAFTGAYYLLNGLGHEDFFRYMLPIAPSLCLLAGGALRAVPKRRLGPALGLGLLLLLPAAVVSAATDSLLSRTDTRQLAAAWLEAHVPAGTSIRSPYYGGPYYSDLQVRANERHVDDRLAASFAQGRYTTRYRIGGPDPAYAVLASGPPEQAPLPTDGRPPLAAFSAGRPGAVYDPLDSFYVPIWGLDRVSRPGPSIVIVRLR